MYNELVVKLTLGILGILLIVFVGYTYFTGSPPSPRTPYPSFPSASADDEVIASNLEVPWALAFLPDKTLLVTERPGRLSKIVDGKAVLLHTFTDVKTSGESGLHGLAVDPDFNNNHLIYIYYTYSSSGNNSMNKVIKAKLEGDKLSDTTTVVDQIPGNIFHDGGRIKFGPDKNLYITTGDAQEPSQAQDKNSLAGKILRVVEGKVEVYSLGHRNPQGIAWDDHGNLWESEHGPSGGFDGSGQDEVNKIIQGGNYGWPTIKGDQSKDGLIKPIIHSAKDTWAPAGMAYLNGSFFFAGLKGQALYEYQSSSQQLITHFKGQFGRIRDVVLGPNQMLYITTSNRDGRGSPKDGDDKIIRINPQSLSDQKGLSANFEIYTLGTKRIFTDSKYHNRSEDVYIKADDPSKIYVKGADVKWSDFFNSLPSPMKVTKECLTTGTNQQFCSDTNQKLKFILNDIETPNVLDLKIQDNDKLIIRYEVSQR